MKSALQDLTLKERLSTGQFRFITALTNYCIRRTLRRTRILASPRGAVDCPQDKTER